jgi:hypothetical protein
MGMTSYHRGIVAGMELAMRICRNRAEDLEQSRTFDRQAAINASQMCALLIRNVQVELGAGRQPLPEFTIEEQDEMNRIR